MTILTILGSGTAFCLENYQTNLLLETEGKRLLIDAGGDIRFSLRDISLSFLDIDAIYISHLHTDHIGGMEYLALSSYFHPEGKHIKLYCHETMATSLWTHSVRGGLAVVQGKKMNIDDYFDLQCVADGEGFTWQDVLFEPKQSLHIFDGQQALPTYGLLFTAPSGRVVYFTSDTQFTPDLLNGHYARADLIIHDCETTPCKTGVHATYEDLKTLPGQIKGKMHLIHYNDNVMDNFAWWQAKAREDGFLGFLKKGEQLLLDKNAEIS